MSEHGKLARKKDANHDEIAGGLRAAGYKVIDTHLVGDGFPDIVVVGGGVYLFEIKNPNTSHGMTPAQVRWHSEWKGQVTVIESLDEALAVPDELDRADEPAEEKASATPEPDADADAEADDAEDDDAGDDA